MENNKDNRKASRSAGSVKGNNELVALGGSLLISAIFMYAMVSPLYQQKLVLDKEYEAKQKDLKNKQELLENIATFNEKNQNLSVNSKKLALLIPNRNDYEDFFIHIQKLSKDNNLELVNFSLKDVSTGSTASTAPGTTTSTGQVITPEGGAATAGDAANGGVTLQQQGVDIALRGDLANFIDFTKALENGIPFLQEDGIAVSRAEIQTPEETVSSNPMLDFSMQLRFIHY